MHCHSCESTNPESFKGFYFYDSLIFIVLGQTPWRNSRNRITNYSCSKPDLFSYNLTYYANSNIYTQSFTGQYKNSFSNQDNLSTSFTYDKSNRLLNANFTHTSDNTFDLSNTFDPDGNILTIQRYGSNNNLLDNFSYVYYSGTNRLKRVSGSSDQFTYDYNGNQTNDYINNNTGIKYDHRNLITEFTRQDLNQDPPIIDITRYKYDEAETESVKQSTEAMIQILRLYPKKTKTFQQAGQSQKTNTIQGTHLEKKSQSIRATISTTGTCGVQATREE